MISLFAQSPHGIPRGHTLFCSDCIFSSPLPKRVALVNLFGVGKVSLAVSLLCTAPRLQLLWEWREQEIIQCCILCQLLLPYQPLHLQITALILRSRREGETKWFVFFPFLTQILFTYLKLHHLAGRRIKVPFY